MKNHEGYTDTTAGKAIRRADSLKFRRQTRTKRDGVAKREHLDLPDRRGAGVPGDTEVILKNCTGVQKYDVLCKVASVKTTENGIYNR